MQHTSLLDPRTRKVQHLQERLRKVDLAIRALEDLITAWEHPTPPGEGGGLDLDSDQSSVFATIQ
jgi:hypothetical protein